MTKMSKRKQENVSDIVAKMRDTCHNPTLGIKTDREKKLEKFFKDIMIEYADRIEAADRRFYDKYKEHTDELNRQILVLKHENEMSHAYFCGYDPDEDLVAQCSTCRFFKKKHSHCTLNDSITNARHKCNKWEFKTNEKCADEYKAAHKNEVVVLREEKAHLLQRIEIFQKVNEQQEKEYLDLKVENARLRDALKPVLECKVMSAMTAEIATGKSAYCAGIIEEAQRIYNCGGESEVK